MTNGRLEELRCKKCQKKLGADLEGQIKIVCPRCGCYNYFRTIPFLLDKREEKVLALK